MDLPEIQMRLLLWLLVGIIFVVVYVINSRRKKKVVKTLKSIATRRGGRLSKTPFRLPSLIIKHKNNFISVLFKPGSRYSPPQTIVSASAIFFTDLEMHIFREGKLFSILEKLGMKEIEIGSDYFDNRFVIRGNDPNLIRNLLDYYIQEKLIDIEYLLSLVSIKQGELRVIVNKILTDENDIDKLINVVMAILDRLHEINR